MIKNSLPAAVAALLLCACAAQKKPGEPPPARAGVETAGQGSAVPGQAQAQAAAAPQAAPPQQAGAQAPGGPLHGQGELQMTSARIGDREALAFRVPVSADGSALRLTPDAGRSLAAIAVRAERVQLRESFEGGTAADYAPDMRDERLRAARAFLVERGVSADRIEIAKSPQRPAIRPGGGGGPAIEILLQLPEPGAALGR